ncbi:MAG: DUF222 domain-containing protein [Acidimicrobiales bacterium]
MATFCRGSQNRKGSALGTSFPAGQEMARVAGSLSQLPCIRALATEGGLSWASLVALACLATPETDSHWATRAQAMSATQLRQAARLHRPPQPQANERSLRISTNPDTGWTRLSGRLPGADASVVADALQRLATQVPDNANTEAPDPLKCRMADALVALASTHVANDADADRACVVVHVSAEALAAVALVEDAPPSAGEQASEVKFEAGGAGEGTGPVKDVLRENPSSEGAQVIGGPAITAEAARRLACDARVEFVAHGPSNQGGREVVVGIGRASRQVPAWLARQLRHRDDGCRFPGCGRIRWTHAHHIRHWSKGGPTDTSNLITLCHTHHVLVHEGGWRISGNPDHQVYFIRPDGRTLATGPPRLREDLRERLFGEAA